MRDGRPSAASTSPAGTQRTVEEVPVVRHGDRVLRRAVAAEVQSAVSLPVIENSHVTINGHKNDHKPIIYIYIYI